MDHYRIYRLKNGFKVAMKLGGDNLTIGRIFINWCFDRNYIDESYCEYACENEVEEYYEAVRI